MDARGPTYVESLKVGWLLTWRLSLVALALGVAFGFLLGLAGALLGFSRELSTTLAVAGTLPLTVFAGYPLVVRMMLRKRFAGFRLSLVRDAEIAGPRAGEPFGGRIDGGGPP